MRLLFLTPFLPDRHATHGGGAYLAQVLASLAEGAEVGLVALLAAEETCRWEQPGHPWRWAAHAVRPPRPRGLASLPHQLNMLWRWRREPLVAAKHWHPAIPGLLARARLEWRPDAVLVEMAQMAQYLPWLQGTPTVLTDHEAGCPANTTTGLGPLGDARDRRLWQGYVRRFYPLATSVQAVTTEDATRLTQQLGRAVTVRPPACAVPPLGVAPANSPPRALFVGDYLHHPNPEAARRLVHDVLPRLRAAQPEVELWFAGPHAECLADLAHVPGVRVLGLVADLAVLFAEVRLLLAPVYSGSGFRMKTLTALAHGLPVVTNELGARGCTAPTTACVRAETPAGLAAAALQWLGDAEAAGVAGRAAHAWACEHLAPRAVAAAQLAALRGLLPGSAR